VFVLGIDPGLSRCGYGVVEQVGRQAEAVAIGVIRTPPHEALPQRLARLQHELHQLVAEYQPEVVAIERVFFQVNVRTAMGVAQASGLAMAEGAAAGAEVVEYTPNQIKEAVGGWGAAPKEQMQRMVQTLLGLPSLPSPADAADAAAVALCHLAHAPMRQAGRDLSPTVVRSQ
jgi:crossover junction endodeoxyribonuclease RuvC